MNDLSPLSYPWIVLGIVWLLAAANVKPVVRRQPVRERLLYTGIVVVGFLLLGHFGSQLPWFQARILPDSHALYVTGLAIEIAGVAFAIWARLALGRNWSGRPSLKLDHELITYGPYSVTRHPIYTGLILAAAGTAVAVDEWGGVAGTLVIMLAFLLKIRGEEQLMMRAFPEAYPTYRKRVKALIPGVF